MEKLCINVQIKCKCLKTLKRVLDPLELSQADVSLLTQVLGAELESPAREVHTFLTAKPYSPLFCFLRERSLLPRMILKS